MTAESTVIILGLVANIAGSVAAIVKATQSANKMAIVDQKVDAVHQSVNGHLEELVAATHEAAALAAEQSTRIATAVIESQGKQ